MHIFPTRWILTQVLIRGMLRSGFFFFWALSDVSKLVLGDLSSVLSDCLSEHLSLILDGCYLWNGFGEL